MFNSKISSPRYLVSDEMSNLRKGQQENNRLRGKQETASADAVVTITLQWRKSLQIIGSDNNSSQWVDSLPGFLFFFFGLLRGRE